MTRGNCIANVPYINDNRGRENRTAETSFFSFCAHFYGLSISYAIKINCPLTIKLEMKDQWKLYFFKIVVKEEAIIFLTIINR